VGGARLQAEQRLDHRAHEDRADHGAVLGRDIVDMGRQHVAGGARHVADDDGGVARKVLAQVPRNQARIEIVAAAGRRTDHDGDGFALVELRHRVLPGDWLAAQSQQHHGGADASYGRHHLNSAPRPRLPCRSIDQRRGLHHRGRAAPAVRFDSGSAVAMMRRVE
jgi:hypothetical protein